MSNCKNCNAPIEIKQGRRPREFCDNNQKCRNEYFRKNKKVATHKTIPIEQWNEIQAKIAENNKPENKEKILAERNGLLNNKINYAAVTPESFDAAKASRVMMDEHGQWEEPKNPNQELITKYQTELDNLGDGQFAKARKKWLEKQIVNLKK